MVADPDGGGAIPSVATPAVMVQLSPRSFGRNVLLDVPHWIGRDHNGLSQVRSHLFHPGVARGGLTPRLKIVTAPDIT